MGHVCWLVVIGFLSCRERCVTSRLSFAFWRRIMSAPLLWRRVDLRGCAIREWQLLRLLQRVGSYATVVNLPTLVSPSPPAVDLPPQRHPAVEWMVRSPEQLPRLRSVTVMFPLDDDAIVQLLANGVTSLCSWNTGVPKGLPPVVIVDGHEPRPVSYNGQVFAECQQQWVAADMCSAPDRQGERCTEAPKFSWHTRCCDWCHRSSCRHCRVVEFRSSVSRPYDVANCNSSRAWSCGCR